MSGPEGRAGVAGPPVFLSNAHFCDVDPEVADTVVGLNCSQSEHVTFLDVEPITGITMRAAKRLMMSTEYGQGQSMLNIFLYVISVTTSACQPRFLAHQL